MRWRSVYVWVALLLLTNWIWSQEVSGPLTLDECIQIALQNNSQLKIASSQFALADKEHKQSYSTILPSVDFFSQVDRFKRGPSSYLGGEFGGRGVFPEITQNNYLVSLSVNQNIFDGGYWWNNIRKTSSDKKVQELGYLTEKQRTVVTVQQSYFALLRELKLLEVYNQAVQRSQEQVERTESMYEVGSVAKVDVFRARVNLGNDRIQYLNQQNVVKKARQNLNLAMGRDPQEPLEIVTEVEYPKQLPDLKELFKMALQKNPALKQLEQDYQSSKLQTKLAVSQYWPRLSAFFGYSRRVPEFSALYRDLSTEFQWSLGVRLSWNLFNGFNDYLNVQKARIGEKISLEQVVDYRRNLMSTVKSLYDNLTALEEIIKINETNLESAKEEYRLAQERYRVGSGTALELREAQVNLTRAEQILVSAEYDAIITHAELQEAIGQLVNAY